MVINLLYTLKWSGHQDSASKQTKIIINGILLLKLWQKICLVIEKKFWNSRREFAKILRSLEQFVRTVKGQFLVTECFLTCSSMFLISNKFEQLEFKLEKKYWDVETCRKS